MKFLLWNWEGSKEKIRFQLGKGESRKNIVFAIRKWDSPLLLALLVVTIQASHFASLSVCYFMCKNSPYQRPATGLWGWTEIKWVNGVSKLKSTMQTSCTVIKSLRTGRTLTKGIGGEGPLGRENEGWSGFCMKRDKRKLGLWSLGRWKQLRNAYVFKTIKEIKPRTPSLKGKTKLYSLTITQEWGTKLAQNTLMNDLHILLPTWSFCRQAAIIISYSSLFPGAWHFLVKSTVFRSQGKSECPKAWDLFTRGRTD